MLFHNDDKGHIIIGEAALSLALSKKEISIATLLTELGYMERSTGNTGRLTQITAATSWLRSFDSPQSAEKHVPYLQTLAGLNEGLN